MAGERQFVVAPSRALRDTKLGPAAKLVLCALGDFTNADGVCWPSVETLEARSSLSRSTVFRALATLEERGWVRRVRRGPRTTLYQVVQDRPIEALKAEYLDVEEGVEEEPALSPPPEMMSHDDTSLAGTGGRGLTMTPLEVSQGHPEGRAGKGELPSSSAGEATTDDGIAHAEPDLPGSGASGPVVGRRVGEQATPMADARGRAGEIAPPAASPAVLRTPTGKAPQPPAAGEPPVDGLAAHFADPDQRAAYLAYRRGHRFPAAYDAELRTLHTPMLGGAPVPWEVIGRQLLQLQANGAEFNARLFAGYCRSAMTAAAEDRSSPDAARRSGNTASRASGRSTEKSAAARAQFLEIATQPQERAS